MRHIKLALALVITLLTSQMAHSAEGKFINELDLRFDADRNGTLLSEFTFIDPEGREWKVPKGAVVNGASIPQALWSIIGSPWTGQYRRASVIHDYYCETKDRGWRNVHRVFYDGMRADGVGEVKAKTMYGAVVLFGPKWKKEFGVDGKPKLKIWTPPYDSKRLEQLEKWIQEDNTSIDEIDNLVQ